MHTFRELFLEGQNNHQEAVLRVTSSYLGVGDPVIFLDFLQLWPAGWQREIPQMHPKCDVTISPRNEMHWNLYMRILWFGGKTLCFKQFCYSILPKCQSIPHDVTKMMLVILHHARYMLHPPHPHSQKGPFPFLMVQGIPDLLDDKQAIYGLGICSSPYDEDWKSEKRYIWTERLGRILLPDVLFFECPFFKM